ncbi:MAG: acyltransferase [Candidatus Dormibacteraeota bacterium]|nr:acyltransferase [Candidatus Dormibacteraeota bacterium]
MTRSSDPSRSRLPGADALRACALIAVLAVHTSAWGPRVPFQSIDQIARFCVPAFIVLTGTVLAYRYTGRPLGAGFARRRAARTLLPWLAWVPVYIGFDVATGAFGQYHETLGTFLTEGAGHLWFLLLIPQFYLLFAVWPRHHRWAVAAAALAVQTALCLARVYITFPGWESPVMLQYASELFPFWIGYFAVGVAVGDAMHHPGALRRVLNVWRWKLTCVFAVATVASGYVLLTIHYSGAAAGTEFLGGTGAFLNPALPPFVFSAGALIATSLAPAMRASRSVAATISVLSEDSLGIYIVHPILLFLIASYVIGDRMSLGGVEALLAWGVLMLATLVTALVVVRLLRATPAAVTLGTTRARLPLVRRARIAREHAA